MARRIAAFAGKDCNVFESSQRSESHLAEDTQAEKREWRRNQPQGMVIAERAAPDIQERQHNQHGNRDQKNDCAYIVDPLADPETESRDAHRDSDDCE